MSTKNEKGSSPLIAILIIILVLLLGGVGWIVMKKDKDDSKKTASSSGILPESSTTDKSSVKTTSSTLPAGWTAFTIGETRIEIAYPNTWGDPSLSTEPGYSNYSYTSTPVSDGKSTYNVSFSIAKDISISLYSNNYLNAPHGGATGYGTVGFCKEASNYKFKQRMSLESGGVGTPACAGDALAGTVSELVSGEAIFDQGEAVCSEGGCSGTANFVVKKLSTTEFTAVLLKGSSVSVDEATKFANYAHSL